MADTIMQTPRRRVRRAKPTRPPDKAFDNPQMSLFQQFLTPEPVSPQCSNAFPMWDTMPLFHMTGKGMAQMRKSGYLPILRRGFTYNSQQYSMEVYPARLLDQDGEEIEYYPSRREEIVADALLKMMSQQGDGFFYEDGSLPKAGVCFTMYQLKKELSASGHGCSNEVLQRSLEILTRTVIEISTRDGSAVCTTSLMSLSRVSKSDWIEDRDATCIAVFNPLLADAVACGQYRQINYETLMSIKSQLGRWIYKRLCHQYRNASKTHPYTLTLAYVRKHTGFLELKEPAAEQKAFLAAVGDLVSGNIIVEGFLSESTLDSRGRVRDIKVTMTPTKEFISEVVSANARATRNRQTGALSDQPRSLETLSDPVSEDSEVLST